VRRAFLLLPLLLLPLLQTACATPSFVPSTTLVESSPTPVPTAIPTAAPANAASAAAFDTHAGNCVDAANQAIALIRKAAAGEFVGNAFTTDMRLDLGPSDQRCAATGDALKTYQRHVGSVRLQVWALDNSWYYAAPTTRQNWLEAVLHYLLGVYPQANVTINALTPTGAACGTASIGAGQAGTPAVNAGACG